MLLPNLPPPVEGIRHRQCNTKAFINARALGEGTLYIAESRVAWAKDGEEGGLSLDYPHIAIHAISRDPCNFSLPCIYLMIDIEMEPRQDTNEDDEDEEEEEHDSGMTEIRFAPADPMSLENMYKALNDCQVLHPNPEDVQSDEEVGEEPNDDEGDYTVTEQGANGYDIPGTYEDNMEGNLEHAHANGDNEEEVMETGQFDDADM
ncbi:Methylosome subunit pICln [Halocaridina rubra]|uniref:Methylosome subunit pICln n=1 Tax=Halocaridina rubra TaxID=373956 RepID=A0AAN8WP61_HALRR